MDDEAWIEEEIQKQLNSIEVTEGEFSEKENLNSCEEDLTDSSLHEEVTNREYEIHLQLNNSGFSCCMSWYLLSFPARRHYVRIS